MSRPLGPCQWCGTQTTSIRQVCKSCRGVSDRGADFPPEMVALTGGQWVIRNGIRRWQPERRRPDPIIGTGPTLEESIGDIVAEVERRAAVGVFRRLNEVA